MDDHSPLPAIPPIMEHRAVADDVTFSKAELLQRMQAGWDEFYGYLETLTEEQLTVPTDAAGWTAADHVINLAVWEESMCGLLDGRPRWESLGIDRATAHSLDGQTNAVFDQVNAVIRRQHQGLSRAEVLTMLREAHQRLVSRVEAMTTEELQKPYRAYQPGSKNEGPVYGWIAGNSYEHYAEHRPWIEAIVASG